MSSNEKPTTRATLGLGGLTMNAMALIAPGAFLWLTFFIQSSYGAPMAAQGMWFGIFAALMLCLATAIAYAELSKLYPGAGSSYFFAEQAFLSKTKAYKFARIAKFMVGWASHLYYWAYPGLMVGVTALVVGYMLGQVWPDTFNATVPSPLFMIIFCPLFALAVAYICFRGVTGTTAVNTAINVIQITALVVFSVIAIGYRLNHPQGSVGITLDPNGSPISKVIATDKDGKPVKDAQGNFVIAKGPDGKEQDFIVDYSMPLQKGPSPDDPKVMVDQFQYHSTASSVVVPHNFNYMFIQACIAILILVGFESVTSMGEEAKECQAGHSEGCDSLAPDSRSGVLSDRIFRSQLLHAQWISDLERLRIGRADRRHDDHRRHLVVRQRRGGQSVHAGSGVHGFPGTDRHDTVLHEHRRARHIRHGS